MDKRKLMLAMWVLTAQVGFASCADNAPMAETPNAEETQADESDNSEEGKTAMSNILNITVGGATFTCTLADNETAAAFKERMPMTITMNELNGNEKYHYLQDGLPTDSYRPGTIEAGDLMLYGADCLVLFYKTFSSSYSYTRIGKIDSPSGLAEAVGSGNVSVAFSLADVSGVPSVSSGGKVVSSEVFTLDGRFVGSYDGDANGLPCGSYIIRNNLDNGKSVTIKKTII